MRLLDLAPEIQHEILESCSPADLASLCRVHTSIQDAAEHLLYRHVYFFALPPRNLIPCPKRDLQCTLRENRTLLRTLSRNGWKAGMVKSFYIELDIISTWHGMEDTINSILAEIHHSLQNVPNLVDLRIIYHRCGDPWAGRISQVMRGGHFRLRTLWLEHGHDFAGIIADQPNLQFLGVYFDHNAKHLWKNMKELFKLQNRMPTICMLKFFLPSSPGLEIFPASYRTTHVLRECREVARSLREFPNYYYYLGDQCHLTFNLFGITAENINLLAEVIEGIATCFRDMHFMAIEINTDDAAIRPWRFPGFVKALSLFETVESVSFHFPGIKGGEMGLFSMDLHRCLVMDLGKAWPKIQRVTVRRVAIRCISLHRTSDWSPVSDVYWDSDEDDLLMNEDG